VNYYTKKDFHFLHIYTYFLDKNILRKYFIKYVWDESRTINQVAMNNFRSKAIRSIPLILSLEIQNQNHFDEKGVWI
jgi:hypothetical protein